jgi:hypothetical protein
MKKSHESGQALVLGIVTFGMASLLALFMLSVLKNQQQSVFQRMSERAEGLRQCQNYAHAFNTITLHNTHILQGLGSAINAWSEASEWSLGLNNAKPFWERMPYELKAESVFQKFLGSAKLAFQKAEAHNNAATKIVRELEKKVPELEGALAPSTSWEAFCLAAQMHHKDIGIYTVLRKKCDVSIYSGKLSEFEKVIKSLPQHQLGIVHIADAQKLENWMKLCKQTSDTAITVVIRNQLFEKSQSAPKNTPQKTHQLQSMLTPAWTAALNWEGATHGTASR